MPRVPSRVRQGPQCRERAQRRHLRAAAPGCASPLPRRRRARSASGAAFRLVLEEVGYGVLGGVVAGTRSRSGAQGRASRAAWSTGSGSGRAGGRGRHSPTAWRCGCGGSGFIAAFVGGAVFGGVRREVGGEVTRFLEQAGGLLGAVTFILFGAVMLVPMLDDLTAAVVVYALLSLTVVRMVPVGLAMLGSGARRPTVLFLGWFGPRGLASIVFAVILVEEADLRERAAAAQHDLPHDRPLGAPPRRDGNAARRALRRLVRGPSTRRRAWLRECAGSDPAPPRLGGRAAAPASGRPRRVNRAGVVVASSDEQRSALSGAAGRAALFPARAAARVWRDQLEAAADEVLSAPEIARVIDRALAGSLPEEIARSIVRHRVLERVVNQLAASGELDRLVKTALASPRTLELTDRMLASDEMQHALRQVASSPEIRDAMRKQTTGLAEEVVAGARASAVRLDGRIERAVSRRKHVGSSAFAGIASRAIALAADIIVTTAMFMSVVGVVAIVASLIGGLRPEWLVGALLSGGWILTAGAYFVLFWSTAGHTPGMRLMRLRLLTQAGEIPSIGRSIVRLAGLAPSIVVFFLGFVPVLFDRRRRGLADFLGGTVVLDDDASFEGVARPIRTKSCPPRPTKPSLVRRSDWGMRGFEPALVDPGVQGRNGQWLDVRRSCGCGQRC